MPEPQTPLSDRPWENVGRMLDVDAAKAEILSAFSPLPEIEIASIEASGLVLAQNVPAENSVPPFRNSAMDGYAVRTCDIAGASWARPIRLRVVGNVAAGDEEIPSVGPGEAVRIMTGAMLPAGADAVVRFEETDEFAQSRSRNEHEVAILRAPAPLDNVREAGEDVQKGSLAALAGQRLTPGMLGMLASVGVMTVPVHRRPVVAVLSTGNEVVEPADMLAPGKIRDSNAVVIASMARHWGAEVTMLGIARDRVDDVTEKLRAARNADLIVTTGGVSLGDYDLVKDVLRAEGNVAIWQVRMKPGKPLAFGQVGGTPLLGLPGNPVAAAISFLLFGRPAIRRMLGDRNLEPLTIEAIAGEPMDNRGQRRHYVRVRLEPDRDAGTIAVPVGEQGAGVLSSFAAADALLVLPEHLEHIEPGTRLQAILLPW